MKSLPNPRLSIRLKKAGLFESTSSNGPCFSQALRMRMLPASSTISASMIPGRSLKSARLASPLVTASTDSRLQSGQSDKVRRGKPVGIRTLSELLGSGLGAQDGCGSLPCGKIESMFLAKDHAAFDNDLVRLAGWADIGRNLLCGFAQRRD